MEQLPVNNPSISADVTEPAEQEDPALTPEELPPLSLIEEASENPVSSENVECAVLLQPETFGERLRNLRAEAGMTVADVAQKLHSSQTFILNLENGDFHKLGHDHYCKAFIERLCLAYDADPVPLLEKFDEESRASGRGPEFSSEVQIPGFNVTNVFGEEDLAEADSGSAALHLPAILIGILVLLLAGLLVSAWIIQNARQQKRREVMERMENELPALIQVKPQPLEVLPIPEN